MTEKMTGKVALVTGGSSGIGRATALAFVREGAVVGIVDVDIGGGEETVRMIKQTGGDAMFIQCDVSQAAEVKAAVDKTVEIYGRLDYAFNNAGIQVGPNPIVDCPEETWNKVLSINLTGVWLCMKYEIPQMLKQGKGAIVNTASVAGLLGTTGISSYTASKHGVVGITKVVALEYAKAGIRVNAVCPGIVKTPMVNRIYTDYPQAEKFFMARQPVGRFGVPEEISEAVVWLCSDSASYVTGLVMAIDGGITAGIMIPDFDNQS